MLDSVAEETKRLEHKLGSHDNAILDEYLTNVRRVEESLKKMQARSDTLASAPAAPIGIPDNFDDHLTVTYDLLHLAFQGDISRVFTFMLGHEGSSRACAHRHLRAASQSRTTATSRGIEKYAKLVTYQVSVRRVRGQLQATPTATHAARFLAGLLGQRHERGSAHDRHNAA
jgi:hypothetical protein